MRHRRKDQVWVVTDSLIVVRCFIRDIDDLEYRKNNERPILYRLDEAAFGWVSEDILHGTRENAVAFAQEQMKNSHAELKIETLDEFRYRKLFAANRAKGLPAPSLDDVSRPIKRLGADWFYAEED
ncbi:MAG: hypothetical protein ACOZBH_04385 [Patescibacteria group bacterium]